MPTGYTDSIVDLFESLGRGAQAEKLKTVKF